MSSPTTTSYNELFVERRILGVRIHDVTYADTLNACEKIITAGQPTQIVTVNTEMIMAARHDLLLRECIEAAYLSVPDGQGLLVAGRLLGQRLRQRVTGSDLMPEICRLAASHGWRPFFLGAAPGVAEQAAAALTLANPSLIVAGCYSGSPNETEQIIIKMHQAKPDILFVAFGVPKEEKWLYNNLDKLAVPLAIGIGGALDFAAGIIPRAPQWMQDAGLEWLFRLKQQPWRWRRMLALPHFLALVFAEAIGARLIFRRKSSRRS